MLLSHLSSNSLLHYFSIFSLLQYTLASLKVWFDPNCQCFDTPNEARTIFWIMQNKHVNKSTCTYPARSVFTDMMKVQWSILRQKKVQCFKLMYHKKTWSSKSLVFKQCEFTKIWLLFFGTKISFNPWFNLIRKIYHNNLQWVWSSSLGLYGPWLSGSRLSVNLQYRDQ